MGTYSYYHSACNQEIATLNEYLKNAPNSNDTTPILDFYDLTTNRYDFSYNEDDTIDGITDVYTNTSKVCKLQGTYNNMPCKIDFDAPTGVYITMDASDTIMSLSEIYLPTAYDDSAGFGREVFNITRIQLGLMEVPSTSDSFDTTLIPVWDFYDNESYIPVLTINAIDGNRLNRVTCTVID